MASDDGAFSAGPDVDGISLFIALPTPSAQAAAHVPGRLRYLEFDRRRYHRAPYIGHGAGCCLAFTAARRNAIYSVKTCYLGHLHESAGRVLSPLARAGDYAGDHSESAISHAFADRQRRIHRHGLLRWRECISLCDRRKPALIWLGEIARAFR
jgi:hypothetical protein